MAGRILRLLPCNLLFEHLTRASATRRCQAPEPAPHTFLSRLSQLEQAIRDGRAGAPSSSGKDAPGAESRRDAGPAQRLPPGFRGSSAEGTRSSGARGAAPVSPALSRRGESPRKATGVSGSAGWGKSAPPLVRAHFPSRLNSAAPAHVSLQCLYVFLRRFGLFLGSTPHLTALPPTIRFGTGEGSRRKDRR